MTGTARHALNWIDGQWIDSAVTGISHDPATYEVIGTFADGGEAAARTGIAAAARAFRDGPWARDRMLRAKVLNAMADAFERHTDQLVEILSLENGKVAYESRFEVSMVPAKLRYYASLVRTEYGRALEPSPGKLSIVLRQPMGVAGIIVPWNSPVVLAIRSLAPALAAGATAVVKMPGLTAQTNTLVARIISELPELPAGVVNTFSESGADGAKLLVEHPDVPVISFTGSTATGRAISAVGAAHLKRFGLELGGKTPMILFEDADLDAAGPVLEKAVTVFAGQFCMTGSRILVHRSRAYEVRELLSKRLEAVKVGPASDPSSDMGPMIDKANVERVDRAVEAAIAQGARAVVRGGPIIEGPLAKGAFYRPTLLEVSDRQSDIVRKETFGPVVTLQQFDTDGEAIMLANESEYGLAASLWTRDLARALRVAREIDAGTIWTNEWAVVHDEFEEGGFKQSGLGRLNGLGSMEDFLEYKHLTMSPGLVAT
jgi:betaine-aldehyde dehydrogenase